MKRSTISSLETFLPEKILTNYDLMEIVDTTDEWIVDRTGIKRRHIVNSGEFTHDIAAKAALKTIESEGISPLEIDAIIVSTITSEKKCPSSASKVQDIIGAKNACAFDVQAACSGFVYGLAVADSFVKSNFAKKVLLIGAETMSLFTNWEDRSTCVLLGDGAGSCIVKESEDINKGIIDINLYSDGSKYDLITIENSEKNENRGHLTMQGTAVFKNAIENMSDSMTKILIENNMTLDDIDWIVPHQANRRILESLCKMKNFPIEKVLISIHDHANTSSASIPLALYDAISSNKVKKGDTLLLTALGAGLVWGSSIIKL